MDTNGLAVVLTNSLVEADTVALTVALQDQGFEASSKRLEDGSIAFDLGSGAEMAVMHVPVPHPKATTMRRDAASPLPEEIAAAKAHIMVGAVNLDRLAGADQEAIDRAMLRATCATVKTTDAVAVMLGQGIYFHRPEVFVGLTLINDEWDRLPPTIVVNVTEGQNTDGRPTLLTHGLERYGRSELLVGCTSDRTASREFVESIIEWLMLEPTRQLEPGQVVPGQSITVGSVASPLGNGTTVGYLELKES